MRWVVFCLAAFVAALVSISPAAQADGQGVTIKVTVLGADGKPVKSAQVYVHKWPDPGSTSNSSGSGATKEDGSFSATTGN